VLGWAEAAAAALFMAREIVEGSDSANSQLSHAYDLFTLIFGSDSNL
jgi:hypothetical protein